MQLFGQRGARGGVPELERSPRGRRDPVRHAERPPEGHPHARVKRLHLEAPAVGRGERRAAGSERHRLVLLCGRGGEVLPDRQQSGQVDARQDGLDRRAASTSDQSRQQSLNGQDRAGRGQVVDGQALRITAATAVNMGDPGGGLGGGLVAHLLRRGDPGPGDFGGQGTPALRCEHNDPGTAGRRGSEVGGAQEREVAGRDGGEGGWPGRPQPDGVERACRPDRDGVCHGSPLPRR